MALGLETTRRWGYTVATPMRVPKALAAVVFLLWTAFSPILPAFSAAPTAVVRASVVEATAADFDSAVNRLTHLDPGMANEYRSLKKEISLLIPDTAKSAEDVPVVPVDTIADFDRRLHALQDRGGMLDSSKVQKEDVAAADLAYSYIWMRVAVMCLKSAPIDVKEISAALTVLESQAETLDKDSVDIKPGMALAAKEPYSMRLNALNAYGTQVWNRLQSASLNVAELGVPVSETPGRKGGAPKYEPNIAGRLGMEVNPLQVRVASLARKLQLINDRLWGAVPRLNDPNRQTEALRARMNPLLTDPFTTKIDSKDAKAGKLGKAGGASGALVFNEPLIITALAPKQASKTLLDMARVPSPGVAEVPDVTGPKPRVYAGDRGRDSEAKETARVNALRHQGKTRTIGDPVKRAAYVYHQEGSTCGLGAQIQVLADAGLVAANPAALKAKEDELFRRAQRLHFFNGSSGDPERRENGGTPNQHVGDLLDMPVRKNFAATDAELFEAVKGGRMIIVGADAGRLWNNRKYRDAGHFVAITGAEVDRKSGEVLGYYINDTGTNEGGRFVTLKQFNAAWHRHSRMFVEPL